MAHAVTGKGHVIIPQPILDRLGIGPGNAVDFEVTSDGRVLLAKVESAPQVSRFEILRGRAGPGPTTDEAMTTSRGAEWR